MRKVDPPTHAGTIFKSIWCGPLFCTFGVPPGVAQSPAASPVAFTVLSSNTHGLPAWIAGHHSERRFPIIGRLASPYDVVLLQEDWSAAYRRFMARRPGSSALRG